MKDALSGVRDITLPDGSVVSGDSSIRFAVDGGGVYLVKARDNCGNAKFELEIAHYFKTVAFTLAFFLTTCS